MPEEEAFAVLVQLMQEYRLREFFKPSMAELGLCMFQLECMIQVAVWASHDSQLICHLIILHSQSHELPSQNGVIAFQKYKIFGDILIVKYLSCKDITIK